MDQPSQLARRASRLTQATRILLVLLGIIHLVATPFLIGWVRRQLSPVEPDAAVLAVAALRLNHMLTGILLLPLGISTFWAGKNLEHGWGFRLALMNAITLLCFPILLVIIMPRASLDAPLFRFAILVLIAACLVQVLALLGFRKSRTKGSSGSG